LSKVDKAIIDETKYVALVVLILSALMEAVFLIIGKWDLTVLFGNLLGGVVSILNFFLMGIGLQSAMNKDPKDARTTVKFSHTMRFLLIAVVLVLAIFVSLFNIASTMISLFFPSLGIYLKVFLNKKNNVIEANKEGSEE